MLFMFDDVNATFYSYVSECSSIYLFHTVYDQNFGCRQKQEEKNYAGAKRVQAGCWVSESCPEAENVSRTSSYTHR